MIFRKCRCKRIHYFYAIVYSMAIFVILYVLDIKLYGDGSIPKSEQAQLTSTNTRRRVQFAMHYPQGTVAVQSPRSTHRLRTKPTTPTTPTCKPKKEFVYIKTHKTASSTACNIFYRFALKHDIPMLLFTMFPYPLANLSLYLLHNEPLAGVENPSERKFMIAADHMRYERKELDKVMTGNPVYLTTLRYPPDHLRSLFHYFHLETFFAFGPHIIKPVQYYIQFKDNYYPPDPRGPHRLENRNANMFGMAEEDTHNETAIQQFIHKMDKEFSLVMITEYFVESLVLLRRTMCWTIGDILFASINIRLYSQKGEPFHPKLIEMHRKWNLADYMMYEYFNQTLWEKIKQEGSDFWDEFDTLLSHQRMINGYCGNVYASLKLNPEIIYDLYNITKPLILPASKWGPAIAFDFVTCALMRVDIMPFANLMRVKQYPDLCKHLSSDLNDVIYLTFRIDRFHNTVKMMQQYCYPNVHKTIVPLGSLTISTMYMWS